LFNFLFQPVIFGNFVLEKASGQPGLGGNAFRGQQVEVGGFIAALFKALDPYPALVDQGLEQ